MTELLSTTATFDDRLKTREAKIGIVGLGYAGLPLAMAFAETGFEVTGIDVNESRVAALKEGRSYLVDVPSRSTRSRSACRRRCRRRVRPTSRTSSPRPSP
jgi:UDP-N-acetyl-D-mannosaminuronate dehydrogenase